MAQLANKSIVVLALRAFVHLVLREFYAIKRLLSVVVARVKMVQHAQKIGRPDFSVIAHRVSQVLIAAFK